MNKPLCLITGAIAVCFLYAAPLHAMVGVSFQWGFDFTLDMDDVDYEPVLFKAIEPVKLFDTTSIPGINNKLPPNIDLDSLKELIDENEEVINAGSPITLSRSNWKRSWVNFGGKVFFDEIPIIDAIELSFNIGAWEYESKLKYPTGQLKNDYIIIPDLDEFLETGDYEEVLVMDSCDLSLERFGMTNLKVFGISKIPYFKMQFDLTIRKNIIAKPDDKKVFKLYLGAGPSMHLGIPILTPAFIEEVIGLSIKQSENDLKDINHYMSKDRLMEDILEELLEEGLKPTWGMHIILGTMLKPPVVPIGIYFDAKYMIPFGDMDKNVDLGGFGFVLNGGIAVTY